MVGTPSTSFLGVKNAHSAIFSTVMRYRRLGDGTAPFRRGFYDMRATSVFGQLIYNDDDLKSPEFAGNWLRTLWRLPSVGPNFGPHEDVYVDVETSPFGTRLTGARARCVWTPVGHHKGHFPESHPAIHTLLLMHHTPV